MSIIEKKFSKIEGTGVCGKCRIYYSEKFKRKVVEKIVEESFKRTKKDNPTQSKTLMNNSNRELLLKEKIILISKFDCCVKILDFASNPFRIIMEYCEGGDLRKILDKYDVPDLDKMTMISQILLAVKTMHEDGCIHGDLRCSNIFLCNKYVPGDYKNIKIKIGLFDLSEIDGELLDVDFWERPRFIDPELLKFRNTYKSDIYSVGKVILEIMTKLPVQKIQEINSSNIITIKDKLPKLLNITQFYDIVLSCLNINSALRPNSNKVYLLFHKILKIWLFGEDINHLILAKYKLGESVPVDSHSHPLILVNCDMRNYPGSGWYCSICNNSDDCFYNNMYSFHCKQCKYDLCYKCILVHDYKVVNEKMEKLAPKGKKVYVSCHPHYLLLRGKEDRYGGNDYSWICDVCKISYSKYIYSFHCKDCGYNLCSTCFEKELKEKLQDKCCCLIF